MRGVDNSITLYLSQKSVRLFMINNSSFTFTDVSICWVLLCSIDAKEIDPSDIEMKERLGAGQFGVSLFIKHSDDLWVHLCLVTPSEAPATDHSAPSSSVLCWCLHLLQLYRKPLPHFLLLIPFPGVPESPCNVHCSTCLMMLWSILLTLWLSQFHFLLLRSRSTVSLPFFHSALSGQCIFVILCRRCLLKQCFFRLSSYMS